MPKPISWLIAISLSLLTLYTSGLWGFFWFWVFAGLLSFIEKNPIEFFWIIVFLMFFPFSLLFL
jgi:hypothetical protein